MFGWFKRKKNVLPSIKLTIMNDNESKVEVEWPHIDIEASDNPDLARKQKIQLVENMAHLTMAMAQGVFTPFVQQKVVERALQTKDKEFGAGFLAAIAQIQRALGARGGKDNSNKPIIKPYQVFDIRNMMLHAGQGGGDE